MVLELSEKQRQKLERDFKHAPEIRKKEVEELFGLCDETETLCLQYLYAYMPAADLVSYSPSYFLDNIRLALEIAGQVPWGQSYDGETFLNFVLPMRVNNEDLTGYRRLFFEELYPRVAKMTVRQAILEVNYWCYEKATYKSTDFRTMSPLGVVRSGYGRCGEESVLLVSALRSVGIAARQNYAPRWAHCDDNHAWVEIYADGEWVFTGACEPEPVLNQAWFIQPASRGMLVQARVFSQLVSEEEVTVQTPVSSLLNVTRHYAKSKILHITVQDSQGQPAAGAVVHPQVLNFAQMFPLAELVADDKGEIYFRTGYGDLFLLGFKDGSMGEVQVSSWETEAVLRLGNSEFLSRAKSEISMVAPSGEGAPIGQAEPPTEEIAAEHARRMKRCDEIRKRFEESFYTLESAKKACEGFSAEYREEAANCLVNSNGNHEEILRFLEKEEYPELYRVKLLAGLRKKDLSDIRCEELTDHIEHALPYAQDFEQETFVRYLLCPHVKYEKIEAYRAFIKSYFSQEQALEFRQNPEQIYRYIERETQDCAGRDYTTLYASPKGLLRYKYGSRQSRDNLFVMISRTFGLPARLNPADKMPEFYQGGYWKRIPLAEKDEAVQQNAVLVLKKADAGAELVYGKSFTIARLTGDGSFQTLDYEDKIFEGDKAEYLLQSGAYRVTTSNRMQDGSCLVNLYTVEVAAGETKVLEIELQRTKSEELGGTPLPEMQAETLEGDNLALPQGFAGGRSVLMCIEVGKEPTEHLLNEIMEQPEQFEKCAQQLLFLASEEGTEQYPLLEQVLNCTGIQLAYWDRDKQQAEDLFSLLGVPHRERPLVLFVNSAGECVFVIAGYNVGTGEQIIKYLLS